MDFNTDILESLDNFKAFLDTKPSKELLKAVKNHLDDFMEGAYNNLDPENYEVAFEEDTGISYDEADEDEFEDWFIKNVLYHDDLSEIYKILKSLVKD
ncbi:hypothetical protein AJY69_04150 [Campylobacter jejuni]|uniref:hypothetical protein n=1 Tax=Campylobacter jejuni TaxID=197 RepID=UPI000874D261|nr:hypothetical protein [Campylobacter jejuni]OEV57244.1 hypothetical protein AJY69_04150 [Campylobacter jejuni]OEV62098.1 hypothetical protein AJY70_00340 [Campylobacter jejuni]OEV66069.1 hypothetical protein AJY74_03250 [Campylobacter jejuni]OEW66782.1 hypothetical protein AJM86_01080 [Campylobacter jejuni]